MSNINETELLFKYVKEKYLDRLDDNQLQEVKEKVKQIHEAVEELRSVTLTNSDEPALVFNPYTEEES